LLVSLRVCASTCVSSRKSATAVHALPGGFSPCRPADLLRFPPRAVVSPAFHCQLMLLEFGGRYRVNRTRERCDWPARRVSLGQHRSRLLLLAATGALCLGIRTDSCRSNARRHAGNLPPRYSRGG
jgi:hypothetical protein